MEKFSKIKHTNNNLQKKKEDNVKFKDDYLKVVGFENWSIVEQKDCAFCLIYLIELNKFMIRQEYIPTFKYVDGQEMHLSLIGGEIEIGETPETALIREIEEEAGIVIRQNFKIEFMKPLFVSKGCSSKYFFSIVQLTENDYHEVAVKPDSKNDKKSQIAKIDIKYIKNLNPSDLATQYLLDNLAKYINL